METQEFIDKFLYKSSDGMVFKYPKEIKLHNKITKKMESIIKKKKNLFSHAICSHFNYFMYGNTDTPLNIFVTKGQDPYTINVFTWNKGKDGVNQFKECIGDI